MVDPSEAGLNSLPKNEEDATISALHAGTLGFDNLSGCRAEMADTFCRFSTGQGYRTRTFYENLGITVVSVKLPILLNGIDATIMRGDLSERCISLKLPTITAKTRLTEQGIWDAFARLHPSLLGALLDAVSMGLRNLPKTHLVDSPRMSDFATWVSACEPAMPWKVGLFIEAYKRKGEEAYADLAEDDSVASALIDYIRAALRPGKEFTGSARELLRDLNEHMEGSPRDPKFWPQSPAALAHKLARLGPVLRSQGVEILKLPRTRGAWSRWRVSRAAAVGDLFPLDLQEAA
jgi:hypothetical protein